MLHPYRADLHIHTCLSPCGSLEMVPGSIIRTCEERKVDIIAVCDHNTAENVQGVMDAAEGTSIHVIPGMEVTTEEEVHILALFAETEQVRVFEKVVYSHLLPGTNDEDLFGIQVVSNAAGEVEGISTRLLIGATTMTVQSVVDHIHRYEGLAVASHIDRPSYSILSQLGFIPDSLDLDGLEISRNGSASRWMGSPGMTAGRTLVTSSDAHRLEEIGRSTTTFMLAEPTFEEIRKGMLNIDGRSIVSGDSDR